MQEGHGTKPGRSPPTAAATRKVSEKPGATDLDREVNSFATRARTEKIRKMQLKTMTQPPRSAAVTASKAASESDVLDMAKDSVMMLQWLESTSYVRC